LIAPRALLIEALEERFAKYPNDEDWPQGFVGELGRSRIEQKLRVTRRKIVEYWSTTAVIQLSHPNGCDERSARSRKSMAPLKAHDIPFWGKAVDVVRHYES
jgi:hypothetical protein